MLKGICTELDWDQWKNEISVDFLRDNHFAELKESEILRERLITRADLTEDQINKRINEAKNELKKSTYFDHLIINDDLNDAFNDAKRIISSL